MIRSRTFSRPISLPSTSATVLRHSTVRPVAIGPKLNKAAMQQPAFRSLLECELPQIWAFMYGYTNRPDFSVVDLMGNKSRQFTGAQHYLRDVALGKKDPACSVAKTVSSATRGLVKRCQQTHGFSPRPAKDFKTCLPALMQHVADLWYAAEFLGWCAGQVKADNHLFKTAGPAGALLMSQTKVNDLGAKILETVASLMALPKGDAREADLIKKVTALNARARDKIRYLHALQTRIFPPATPAI